MKSRLVMAAVALALSATIGSAASVVKFADMHFESGHTSHEDLMAGTDATPQQRAQLKIVADQLKHDAKLRLQVVGHTDNRECGLDDTKPMPDQWTCDAIGRFRATFVSDQLIAAGVDKSQLLAPISKGSSEPVASNETDDGRQANRRVEFKVITP